jgi:ATP-dependent helicase HrpB
MRTDSFLQVARDLPIGHHLKAITSGIRTHPISIIQSSPGSGKTTILPIALALEDWLADQKTLVLQPRRLAAKSVANRMAALLNEAVGNTVGYQIRLEQKRSTATRIEVITEGLLTRRLVADPALSGVGAIIFDEFHERNAHADIGLALAREVQSVLRPDLRIVIMSATLNTLLEHQQFENVWRYSFDSAPFPVDIRHLIPEPRRPIWEETARVIRSALSQHPGDLLAFLPGRYEIEACNNSLANSLADIEIIPLYGELPFEQQQLALMPSKNARRKVVLATPIAETSLTIDGVRIVVDSGLHKVARSDATGSTDLTTERITRDSADQRAGRAGRTAPGVCLRLWSDAEHKTLRAAREPEILRTDVAPHVLELCAWGVRDVQAFSWITSPPTYSIEQAMIALQKIGAIRSDCTPTERGLQMCSLGTHPRIASLCLESRTYGLERYAAAVIPLLEERLPTGSKTSAANIAVWTDSLLDSSSSSPIRLRELYAYWLNRIQKLPQSKHTVPWEHGIREALGYLLAVAFPERIARRRDAGSGRYLLASGRGAALHPRDPLCSNEYLVAASLQHRDDDSAIVLAAPLNESLFESLLAHLVSEELQASFDEARGVLIASKLTKLGAIILREERRNDLSRDELRKALVAFLRSVAGHERLPFSPRARALQARSAWARTNHTHNELPDISDHSLRESEPFWLSAVLPSSGRLSDITSAEIDKALDATFSWNQGRELQRLAPESMTLPSGKTRAIDYSQPDAPAVDAMIQELFGLASTPTIGDTRIPVTLRLLSPARRPMQVTKDLASFWMNGYPEVRKELRGRYPKHRWPEDPLYNRK